MTGYFVLFTFAAQLACQPFYRGDIHVKTQKAKFSTRDIAQANLGCTMPISRLDLPTIAAAIDELHRVIEFPPDEHWEAPVWLIEQFKKTTDEKGLHDLESNICPGHDMLIHYAAREVLNRMMPPWHHTKKTCPEIDDSSLDREQKIKLRELRLMLTDNFFHIMVIKEKENTDDCLSFLKDVLRKLQQERQ